MPPPRFWEFAHLTDAYKTMGWVDEVPRSGGLYIGGLHALYSKPDLFERAKITHILSVIDYDIGSERETGHLDRYTHLLIRVEDDPNENLLQYFEQTNRFIDDALRRGGRVFVHCAMGKSRSATVVCAYLMFKERGKVGPVEALKQVCEGRPVCQPNPGFMEQLEVFARMLKADGKGQAQEICEKWLKDRFTGDWWTWDARARQPKL